MCTLGIPFRTSNPYHPLPVTWLSPGHNSPVHLTALASTHNAYYLFIYLLEQSATTIYCTIYPLHPYRCPKIAGVVVCAVLDDGKMTESETTKGVLFHSSDSDHVPLPVLGLVCVMDSCGSCLQIHLATIISN